MNEKRAMTLRTILVPLHLLKSIDKLRRRVGNQSSNPDEMLVRCLTVGLAVLQKEPLMLKGYREGPLFLEKGEP